MKLKTFLFCAGISFLALAGARAAEHSHDHDAIAENFFPPELVQQFHEVIGLTDDQMRPLQEEFEKVKGQAKELQSQIKTETEALTALAKESHVDEQAAQAEAGKIVDLEGRLRRLQLGLLVKIKNALSPEQQAELKGLKNPELQAKVHQAVELAHQWQEDGRDTSELQEMKEEFIARLKEKKFAEAEAVVDKALKVLEEK